MTVSHYTDNKFGISRFTREKKKETFLYDHFFLLWLNNYSQRAALFDQFPGTILPLLVLGSMKRKPSSLFTSWGSAPSSSNTEAGLLQKFQMKINLFFHHLVALHCHSSRWIQHPMLVSQIIIIKNHGSRDYQNHVSRGIARWFHNSRGIKPAIQDSQKYPLPPSFKYLTVSIQWLLESGGTLCKTWF